MKALLLSLVVALQTAFLLGTVVMQERSLHSDPTVLLETVPVDPRDLLRGDFVMLSYKISRIPWATFEPPLSADLAPGTSVYVHLAPAGRFHVVGSASLRPPQGSSERPVLRATVQGSRWNQEVSVRYGLEKYFVREGTGSPRGTVTVQAAIARSGTASIKEVFVNQVPYREAMKDEAR